MLVVLDHLWPNRVPGGYVGVDVFFVISGYLISAHLLKEVHATGGIRLGAFYARRIRRLLPAAFTVLIVSMAATLIFLPFARWLDTAQEIAGSAFYVENWILAAKSVDYSASTASATVAQHYWSLSVEEQFYIVWPLLILGLVWIAQRLRRNPRHLILTGVAVVAVASLCFSVYFTNVSPSEAYFFTPVRAWEFGAGAAVALVSHRIRLNTFLANAGALCGFAAIAFSAFSFGHSTPFPGWTALLPVAGTAMVIISGTRHRDLLSTRLASLWPIQFLGNISYSLYLWHWPLIVIGPFVLNSELGTIHKAAILFASVGLAWLTKRFVEDRGLQWKPASRATAKSFVAMAACMALIAAASAGQAKAYEYKVGEAERLTQEHMASGCYGPKAMNNPESCPDRFGKALVPEMSEANNYYTPAPECAAPLNELMAGDKKTTQVCDFSGGKAKPNVVWLVGDSHAQQWEAPIFELARQHNWLLKISFVGGCPAAAVEFVGSSNSEGERKRAENCRNWSRDVSAAIVKDKPGFVFTSSYARTEKVDDKSGRSQLEQYVEGFGKSWSAWAAAGAQVRILVDPPLNEVVRARDCLAINKDEPLKCAVARTVALPADPQVAAAERLGNSRVKLVDLTNYFCDREKCYGVIGGVAVYYDANHLNVEYSKQLGPMIERQL